MAADTLINYDIPFHKSQLPGIRTALGKPIVLPIQSSLVFNCGVFDFLGNFEASPAESNCLVKLHNLNADGSLGSQITSQTGSISGSKTIGGWKGGAGHASVEIPASAIPISTFTGTTPVRMSLWIDSDMIVADNVLLVDWGSSIIAGGTLVFDGPPAGGTIRGWWDASKSATTIGTTGSDVDTWAAVTHATVNNPLIDNGDNTWTDSTSKPVLTTAGLGGLDTVRFDSGSQDQMDLASGADRFFSTAAMTVMVLMRAHASTPSSELFFGSSASSVRHIGFTSGKPYLQGGTSLVHGSTIGNTWRAISAVWTSSGAASNIIGLDRTWTTGTHTVSGSITSSTAHISLGGFNWDIAEIVIIDGAESTTDMGLIIDFFNSKWGTSI